MWLDRCCLDQNNLGVGLKVLCVNLMACDKLLILFGETFTQRLWCMWEIFTLMAFMPTGVALKKIEVLPLGTDRSGTMLLEEVRHFDYRVARCYDPNEEAKIKAVIECLGGNDFNHRMHALAEEWLTIYMAASEPTSSSSGEKSVVGVNLRGPVCTQHGA